MGIVFYGDPKGQWAPLFRAVERHAPTDVVLVGDNCFDEPITTTLAPLFEAGIGVWWIVGNQDGKRQLWLDNLYLHHREGNLHGIVQRVGGLTFAGLGGVFRGSVWYPRERDAEPTCCSRPEHLDAGVSSRQDRPFRNHVSIFPRDVEELGAMAADILVCHEAPTSHECGFPVIDDLAAKLGARLIVHGHHHRSYSARLPNGIDVIGLGIAEPMLFEPVVAEADGLDTWRMATFRRAVSLSSAEREATLA